MFLHACQFVLRIRHHRTFSKSVFLYRALVGIDCILTGLAPKDEHLALMAVFVFPKCLFLSLGSSLFGWTSRMKIEAFRFFMFSVRNRNRVLIQKRVAHEYPC